MSASLQGNGAFRYDARAMPLARGLLVGRRPELDHLESSLDRAVGGAGSIEVLRGEAGIGKTRLAEELAAMARARGIETWWGRAWEAGGAPAYWPWVEVLRALMRRHGVDIVSRSRARALAQILPELRDGTDEETPPLPPDQARFMLLEALVGTLAAAATRAPAVIVIDDAHAADVESLLGLELLHTQVRSIALLVVVTARPTPLGNEGVGPVLARIERIGMTTDLPRLTRDDVVRYVSESARTPIAEQRVQELYARSEGNPLFLVELTRWLHHSQGELPSGIRAVIAQRREALREETRRFVDAASILGREVALDIAVALAGLTADEADHAKRDALDAGIMEPAGDGHLRFTHVLLRDALHADLREGQRHALHARAAELLAERAAVMPPWSEIAHHWLLAGDGHLTRATAAARAAAEQASAQLAFDDAVSWLERAQAAELRRASSTDATRGELMIELARAKANVGDVDGARALCRKAADLARAGGDVFLFGRAALESGRSFVFGKVDDKLLALIDEALQLLPESETGVRARLLARRAAALQPSPNPEALIAEARAAVALARRLNDDAVLLETLRSAASTMADLGDPHERVVVNEEMVAIARRLRDPFAELRAAARAAIDHFELAQMAEGDRALEQVMSLAQRLASPHVRWHAAGLVAMRRFYAGDFAEAERATHEAQSHGERARDPNARHALAIQRLARAHVLRDANTVLRELEIARDTLGGTEIAGAWLETLAVGLRREHVPLSDRERAAIAYGIAIGDTSLLAFLAERAARFREVELAELLEARLRPRRGQLASWGVLGLCISAPIDGLLGLVDVARGRWDDAVADFERARALAHVTGGLVHEASVLTDLASALLARDCPGDRERAAHARDEARAIAMRLGIAPLSAIVEAAEETTPRVVSRPLTVSTPKTAITLARVGEVWEIAGEGERVRLEDKKGVRYLAALLEAPGRPLHVLELASTDPTEVDRGDAGDLLDAAAIDAYRARVRALKLTLDDETVASSTRENARSELEAVEDELVRGLGLGGRSRRAGSHVERARVNVQRRIKDAIRRVAEHAPLLAKRLDRAVRTGTFCVFDP